MSPDFQIVVDHREASRDPYRFPDPATIALLPVGNYSIAGYEQQVAIKRLTAADLFLSCGARRDEFLEFLDAFAAIPSRHLILETTLEGIYTDPPDDSRMAPRSVQASLVAWQHRYNIALWPFSSREAAELWAWEILIRWYRDSIEGAAEKSAFRRAKRQADAILRPLDEQHQAAAQAAMAREAARAVVRVGVTEFRSEFF